MFLPLLQAAPSAAVPPLAPAPALPRIDVTDATVVAPLSGKASAAFTVWLSAPSTTPVTVHVATVSGSATAPADFKALSKTLTFKPGKTKLNVNISVLGNPNPEPTETFHLQLSNPTGARPGRSEGVGTIEPIASDSGLSTMAIGNASVIEGDSGKRTAQFKVTFSPAPTAPVTFAVYTANGSATTADHDYTALNKNFTAKAGTKAKTISVAITPDIKAEPDETLQLALIPMSSGLEVDPFHSAAVGFILNDDSALSIHREGPGRVTSDVGGIDCGASCTAGTEPGTTVTLTQQPDPGAHFEGWSGACSYSLDTTCTIMVGLGSTDVYARFSDTYMLSVYPTYATVISQPNGIACPNECLGYFTAGTSVTLTAYVPNGADAIGWSGDCTGTQLTCTVTMDQTRNVQFLAMPTPADVNVGFTGTGTGTVTSPYGSCTSGCTLVVPSNELTYLSAVGAPGSEFRGWTGCAFIDSGYCAVYGAASVSARFERPHTVTITTGGGGGSVGNAGGGITCSPECTGLFDEGTVLTLVPIPDYYTGAVFMSWGGACTGTAPTCTITVNGDVTASAVFGVPIHVAADGPGHVASTPPGLNCASDCAEPFAYGSTVTLTAVPDQGAAFASWSGGSCGYTPTCEVPTNYATDVLTGGAPITAHFSQTVTQLSVATVGNGTVTSAGLPGLHCPSSCSAPVATGSTEYLSATPDAGWTFDHWEGACTGTGGCAFNATGPTGSVTAVFVYGYVLTIDAHATSGVTTDRSGTSCAGTCTTLIEPGGTVTVTAHADSSADFVGWYNPACSDTTTVCTLPINAPTTLSPTFLVDLSISVVGPGSAGAFGGADITCYEFKSPCLATVVLNNPNVLIYTSSSSGVHLVGFSGDCTGTACHPVLDRDITITTTFAYDYYTNVSVVIDGAGSVYYPPDFSCDGPSTCLHSVGSGFSVLYTASYNGMHSRFVSWEGCDQVVGIQCYISNIFAPRTVTAHFEPTPTLDVTLTSGGSVTGSQSDRFGQTINCPTHLCGPTSWVLGSTITLTAETQGGYEFDGWSGACTGMALTCTLTITSDVTAHAQFRDPISVGIVGHGRVTSDPPGIDCPGACNQSYVNTNYGLHATPDPGWSFAGWTGACEGDPSPDCWPYPFQDVVTATFVPIYRTVTLVNEGLGTLRTSTGMNCTNTCQFVAQETDVISVVPVPTDGWGFLGWTQGCGGTDPNTCSITVGPGQNSVAARYGVGITVAVTGGGTVTSSQGGIVCTASGGTCTGYYYPSSINYLLAQPAPGKTFLGWGGACMYAVGTTCALQPFDAVTATAAFSP